MRSVGARARRQARRSVLAKFSISGDAMFGCRACKGVSSARAWRPCGEYGIHGEYSMQHGYTANMAPAFWAKIACGHGNAARQRPFAGNDQRLDVRNETPCAADVAWRLRCRGGRRAASGAEAVTNAHARGVAMRVCDECKYAGIAPMCSLALTFAADGGHAARAEHVNADVPRDERMAESA